MADDNRDALNVFCRYLGGLFLSFVADVLFSRGYLTLTSTRRLLNSLSSLGPAAAVALASFAACDDAPVAILVTCVGFFLSGGVAAGHLAAYMVESS